MFIYSHHYFILLKDCVLAKAGIKPLIPSECQRLSALIFSSTRKRVSETTIKRIYGFAISKFNPSPFTLQTLAEYCGYDGWEEFCGQESPAKNQPTEKLTWQNLCTRANRITQFTLQSLKKRSGIPFDLTIKRKFIKEHFDNFLQTNQQITLFTAPADYGKTIGLCHLISELIEQNDDDSCNKNIVLFFSSNTITTVSPNDLNLGNWLLSFLGLQGENNLIELFEERNIATEHFYLVIDGFEEHMFKQDQYLLFFNQLIDISSYYSKYSWFKIIFTMRSNTWLNHRYLVDNKPVLWERWYTGFMQDENKTINFLPFSTDEILDLTHKINPAVKSNNLPAPELIKKLSNPLLFQLYYQNHPQNFNVENADLICFYEMMSTYALNKIYHGSNSTEKILIIIALLEKIDFCKPPYSIEKIKFYDAIKTYPNTYKELISNNIFREENFSKYLHYEEQISFGNISIMEYCLARNLYRLHHEKLNSILIAALEKLLEGSSAKVPVIRWLVFFIISSNSNEQLNYLKDIILQPSERLEVIVFTCQMLQKQLRDTPDKELLKSYFVQIEQNETFNFFLSLQYITPDYEKAICTLLQFDLNNRNKILINTTLAIISLFNLNADKAEKYMYEISRLPDIDREGFIVNPLNCLDTIYSYLKYGIVKTEALQEITHLYYNDSKIRRMTPGEYSSNEIIFKLALLTLKINNNPAKELRFIYTVKKYIDLVDSKYTSAINIFFLSLSSTAYLQTGNIRKAIKTQSQILQIQHAENSIFTPFMKVLFNILSIRNSAHNQTDKVALLHVKSLIAYSNKKGFKLAEVYAGISYLSSSQLKDAAPENLSEIYNNTLKQIRSSGFRMESFINPNLQEIIESKINRKVKVA